MTSTRAQQDLAKARFKQAGIWWLMLRVMGAIVIMGAILAIVNGWEPLSFGLFITVAGIGLIWYGYYGEWRLMRSLGIKRNASKASSPNSSGSGQASPAHKQSGEQPQSVSLIAPAPPKELDSEVVGTRFCPACGTTNPKHYAYCKKCSNALPLPP
jgi:hypothetical protein